MGEWKMEPEEIGAGAAAASAEAFETFRRIIETLRGEDGCPWDRAQTFESLKPCMINEMTEALAGIDLYKQTGCAENLCEELGDVMMLVMLLAQIAKEDGLFDITDVLEGISRKMVRRHPYVFGDEAQHVTEVIPGLWEEIKREERKNRTSEEERAEKLAFHAAAGQVICHLSEK